MQQQTVALLLSALVLSTLGHEHRRAEHHQSRSHFLSRYQQRNEPQGCYELCTAPSEAGNGSVALNITTISESSVVIAVNIEAHAAVVFDANNELVALFNGASGQIIFINTQSQQVIYIAEQSSYGWSSSETSAGAFFSTDFSLVAIWQEVKSSGETCGVQNANDQITKAVAEVLVNLSVQYFSDLSQSQKQSVAMFYSLATSMVEVISSSNGKILELIASSEVVFAKGIDVYVGILKGFGEVVQQLGMTIEDMVAAHIAFDLAVLGSLAGGIYRLAYFIGVIGQRMDISKSLSTIVSSAESFFTFAASFSGEVDAVVVVKHLLLVLNDNNNVSVFDEFMGILIEYSSSDSAHTTDQFAASINVFIQITKNFKIEATFLQEIAAASYLHNGVSIGAVIEALAKAGTEMGINVLISVLVLIHESVSIQTSIVRFIFHIVSLMVSGGIYVVTKLIPDLITFEGNLIKGIIGLGVEIAGLFIKIATEGLYAALKTIKIFAIIFQAMEEAATSVHVQIDIKASVDYFNGAQVLKQIQAICSHSGGVSGGYREGRKSISGGLNWQVGGAVGGPDGLSFGSSGGGGVNINDDSQALKPVESAQETSINERTHHHHHKV